MPFIHPGQYWAFFGFMNYIVIIKLMGNYNWLLLSIFAGLSSDIYNFLNRKVLKNENDASSYAWWYEVTKVIIFIVALPFFYYFTVNLENILLLLILGLVEFISVYVFMKMHAYIEISISSIVAKLRLVWTPIIAFLILHEALKNSEYVGIFVIFLGLIITVSPRKIIFDKGIKFALLSSMIVPVISVLLKRTSDFSSTSIQMVFMGLPAVFLFPVITKNWKTRVINIYKKSFREIFIATIFNCSAMALLILAFKVGSVGKVASVYQSMTIISVIAGILLLKERENVAKKLIGAAVTTIGIMLLV